MSQTQATGAKRSAAQASLLAAAGITLLKLLTGILAGSLGMLSEAAHSFIDLIASAITLLTVRVADMPADEEHNYGHGKLESLSAAFETVLMVGSCVWIAREGCRAHDPSRAFRPAVVGVAICGAAAFDGSGLYAVAVAAPCGVGASGAMRWRRTLSTLGPTSGRRLQCF